MERRKVYDEQEDDTAGAATASDSLCWDCVRDYTS